MLTGWFWELLSWFPFVAVMLCDGRPLWFLTCRHAPVYITWILYFYFSKSVSMAHCRRCKDQPRCLTAFVSCRTSRHVCARVCMWGGCCVWETMIWQCRGRTPVWSAYLWEHTEPPPSPSYFRTAASQSVRANVMGGHVIAWWVRACTASARSHIPERKEMWKLLSSEGRFILDAMSNS